MPRADQTCAPSGAIPGFLTIGRRRRPLGALRALGAAACALAMLPSPATAAPGEGAPEPSNPHVATATELYKQSKLKEADAELQAARGLEHNTRADEVQLQLLDGMLRAVSADDELARAAFARALQLDSGAALPDFATARARRLFEQARAELQARAQPRQPVAAQFAKLSAEGKLDGAEELLAQASARTDMTKVESEQLLVLKRLLLVLKTLRSAGPSEGAASNAAAQRAEQQLKDAEEQLAATAGASLTGAEYVQQLALKGLLFLVKGLVLAKSGDEAQAKAAFAQALDLDPTARVPSVGMPKVEQLFEAAKAALPPVPPASRGLPGRVARLYADGKLEQAELLLARSSERTNLTEAESGQLSVLKGLLLALKSLQKTGPEEEERAKAALGVEGELEAIDDQLAAMASPSLTETESAQHLVLKDLVLVVRGLVKAEAGDEAQAKVQLAQALELDPEARLPSLGSPRAQKLFESTRAAVVAKGAEQPLPAQVVQLYVDGKLERAELLLAEQGERADLTRVESRQISALRGLLLVLKGLQRAGTDEEKRAKVAVGAEGELEAVKEQLAAMAAAPLGEAESGQHLVLKDMLLVVKGLMKAEAGDEAQAKAAFTQALELSPDARVPSLASPRAQKLFDAVKASAAAPPASQPIPAQVAQLCLEGRLERAELLMAGWAKRPDLSKAESTQLQVLRGLLQAVKDIRRTGQAEAERTKAARDSAEQLGAAQKAYAALPPDEARAAPRQSLDGLLQVVQGSVLAESGDEARAKVAFVQALKLNPAARPPAGSTSRVNRVFDDAKASVTPRAAAPSPAKVTAPAAATKETLVEKSYWSPPARIAVEVLLGVPSELLGTYYGLEAFVSLCHCYFQDRIIPFYLALGLGTAVGAYAVLGPISGLTAPEGAWVGALVAIPAGAIAGLALGLADPNFTSGLFLAAFATPLLAGIIGAEVVAAGAKKPEHRDAPRQIGIVPVWSVAPGGGTLGVAGVF